ncbi:MAG: transcriptional repressor [Calditrichota bacterium]
MRKTKAVLRVQEFLDRRDSAVSVVELVEHLNDEMNKVTVYRILARLEEEGLIHSFLDKDGLTWYAKCQNCERNDHNDNHPHFQCNKCSNIICLPISIKIPAIENHYVEKKNILLIGICEECRID